MYNEILVPTNGSDSIGAVLDHTREIAKGRDTRVHVLYVIDDQAFLTLDDSMKDEVIADLRQEGEAAIEEATAQLQDAGLEVTTAIRKGKPSAEIISYVETADIDLVTMGTRGDEYTENILGSTAQKIVTSSPVPVLTVNITSQ